MAGSRRAKSAPVGPGRVDPKAPAYTDAALIADICERLRRGWSEASACMVNGLSPAIVSVWRGRIEEQGEDADPALVGAVSEIARANGDALGKAEEREYQGDPGARHWMRCRFPAQWGQRSEVEVTGINPGVEVSDLLKALAGVE